MRRFVILILLASIVYQWTQIKSLSDRVDSLETEYTMQSSSVLSLQTEQKETTMALSSYMRDSKLK